MFCYCVCPYCTPRQLFRLYCRHESLFFRTQVGRYRAIGEIARDAGYDVVGSDMARSPA